MDDGLTFRFVFSDESAETGGRAAAAPSSSPAAPRDVAPPDARPGEAAKQKPSPSTEAAPPQPRRPQPDTSPAPRASATPGARAEEKTDKASPVDRSEDRPRRRRAAEANESGPENRRPRRPTKEQAATDKRPGEAAKLLGELIRHLQQLPGIGRAIASLYHVAEPLVAAGKQIRQIRAEQAKRQERGENVEPAKRELPPQQKIVPPAPPASNAPAALPSAPSPPIPRAIPLAMPAGMAAPTNLPRAVPVGTPPVIPRAIAPPVAVPPPIQPGVRLPTVAGAPPIVPAPRLPPTAAPVAQPRPPEKASPVEIGPAPKLELPPWWNTIVSPLEKRPPKPTEPREPFDGVRTIRPIPAPTAVPAPRKPPTSAQEAPPEPAVAADREAENAELDDLFRRGGLAEDDLAHGRAPVFSSLGPAPKEPSPSPSQVERAPPESGAAHQNAPGFSVAKQPDHQAALEKLIAALGPLPESNRELKQSLEPLTTLGYTMTELVAAVKEMERSKEERVPGVEGARPADAAETAEKPPSPTEKEARESPAPEKHTRQPSAPTAPPQPPAPRQPDNSPSSAPTPGAAAPAAEAAEGLATAAGGAAEGTAVAGAATLNPALLIAGVALVAVVGTATRVIGGLAKAAVSLDRAFQGTAKELALYNGQLAAAQANAQARKVVNDVDRANMMGGSLAEFTDARASLSRSMDRILDIFSKLALDRVTPILETIANAVEPIANNADLIAQILDQTIRHLPVVGQALANILDALKLANKLKKRDNDLKLDPNADIFGIFGGQPGAFRPGGAGAAPFGDIENPFTPPGAPGMGLGGV